MIKRKDYELNMMWQAATKDKSSKSKNERDYKVVSTRGQKFKVPFQSGKHRRTKVQSLKTN